MKLEYRYKSKMENDKLVIDGKKYGVNDLNQLPQKLQPFEVITKSNEVRWNSKSSQDEAGI